VAEAWLHRCWSTPSRWRASTEPRVLPLHQYAGRCPRTLRGGRDGGGLHLGQPRNQPLAVPAGRRSDAAIRWAFP
jgi:hypothetical protein